MKNISTLPKSSILFTLLLFTSLYSFSITDNLRLGLQVSPGIAWSNPVSKDLQRGIPHFGVDYGLVVEYWFAKNYGLSTGLGGSFDGFNVKGRDAFQNDPITGTMLHPVTEKYKFNYLELPVYLKLKTNDFRGRMKRFCGFGQVGFNVDFTLSGRANYSDSIPTQAGGEQLISKENIFRRHNEVGATIPNFHSNFVDIRLSVGAGLEYRLDEKTSFVGGLFYNNGFVNNILNGEPKGNPNLMRLFCLRLGVLF